MKLTKKDGTSAGTFFDKIFESDAPLCQFKLGRFLYAIGIDLTKNGVIELSQIAKLVKGKRIRIEGSGENAVVTMIENREKEAQ